MQIIGIVLIFCQSEGVMTIYMVARTCLHLADNICRSDFNQMRGSMEGNQEAVEVGNMEGRTVDYIP
jgi:hypothetical protein